MADYLPSAPVNDEAKKRNGNLPGQGGVFNVVNLHVYHYAGNNPVKYVDPEGRWDDDVHYGSVQYGGTLKWAQDGGRFTEAEAKIIAGANKRVDGRETGPMPWQDPGRHFNTNKNEKSGSDDDSRMQNAIAHLDRAMGYKKEAMVLREKGGLINNLRASSKEKKALMELGKGLHSLQDIFAHTDDFVRDFLGISYHASEINLFTLGQPNQADNPLVDRNRIRITERATKVYLDTYLRAR